jgi:hypothetical protein
MVTRRAARSAAYADAQEAKKTPEELRPFEVTRTRVCDSRGVYCDPGETAMLNRAHAASFHSLGYVKMDLETLYANSDGGKTDPYASEDVGEDDSE